MIERDEIAREARSVLAAARALIQEFAEEGGDQFDRSLAASAATATTESAKTSVAPTPTPTAGESVRPVEPASEPQPEPPSEAGKPAPSWPDRVSLEEVRQELGDCQRCGLCAGRRQIVFGDGNPDADLMFIGEGPGEQEDLQGVPFVGRAGELLTQMIEKGLGLSRNDVYICNIVKCRPPGNRNPLPPEVSACRPFLAGQIKAVRPKVIVTLGKPAASLLLDREIAITRVRGTWHDYDGIPLMPTLHPAYILRQYTPENRRAVWGDLKQALARARETNS